MLYFIKSAFWAFLIVCLYYSCYKKKGDKTLFYNAKIHSFSNFQDNSDAFIIQNGRILEVGLKSQLLKKYSAECTVNLEGKYVYPGFNDAHAHFYGLGKSLFSVNLVGTHSWEEVLSRCIAFQKKNSLNYLVGRGWDQNDWNVQEFPTNKQLNKLFPNIPVLLTRIDGHAAVVNKYLLSKASFDISTKIEGGEIKKKEGQLTGVLIDNAVSRARKFLPPISRDQKIKHLLKAEQLCFQNGITSLTDAGLDPDMFNLIDSLQQNDVLKIRIYGMISASLKNVQTVVKQRIIKTDRLHIGSFKLYADGALGSRGAYLTSPYSDKPNHKGFLLRPKNELEKIVKIVSASNYQLNTHCIGDKANQLMLELYSKYLPKYNNRRWRIEHAQIVNPKEYKWFSEYGIIPSVQPTHATSDMYWAEQRVGNQRIKYAYPYKSLLRYATLIALGTDAPVENINPFFTFYASVTRMDSVHFPKGGFFPNEALTREETLKGMTLWPAFAAFEEQEKGSIEAGRFADFIVLDINLMHDDLDTIRNAQVVATYCGGEQVFSR